MVPATVENIGLAAPTTYIYIYILLCVSCSCFNTETCIEGGGGMSDPTKTRSFLFARIREKYNECLPPNFREKYVTSVRRQNVQNCALHSTNLSFFFFFFYLIIVTKKKKKEKG